MLVALPCERAGLALSSNLARVDSLISPIVPPNLEVLARLHHAVPYDLGIIYFTPELIINGIFIAHNVLDSLGYLCQDAVVGSTT